METNEEILKELKEIAPMLSAIEKKNFYSVPENYFDDFTSDILVQIKLNEVQRELKTLAPELLKLEKKMMAELPADYFKSFSGDLVSRIRANEVAAELKEIAPVLSSAQRINQPEVPANYFAAFPQQVMRRIAVEQKASEVTEKTNWLEALNNRLENILAVVFKPKFLFAYAGMASIVIVTAIMLMKAEQQCDSLDCKMAALSNDELNTYLDNGTDVATEEIFEADFTNNTVSEPVVKGLLNDVSDEELNNAILD